LASRIYISGPLLIEHDGRLVRERQLAGRQGRLAFAYLVARRATTTTRDQLTEVVWPEEPPAESDVALSAILSKLRSALKSARLPDAGIVFGGGTIHLRLATETHVDIEDAANAVDEAEGAWRRRDLRDAWGHANVAVTISRRPFLAREEAPWIEVERRKLRATLLRGLSVLGEVSYACHETEFALQCATEIVDLEPFRETGYQQLMRLHAALGNRGEALRVFGRLRELLRDELGTSPSPQTEAVFREILTA
jgi:DNA-binding SARP family transcriptional activator